MLDKEKMNKYIGATRGNFNFSSGIITDINGKKKREYFISGKPNKKNLIAYMIFILAFSIMSFITAFVNFAYGKGEIAIYLTIIISLILPFIIAAFKLMNAKKYYKKVEPKPINIDLYKRELPSNLKPAHVRMMLTDGRIDEKSLAATILDLIDRGYIEVSTNNNSAIFNDDEITLTRTNKDVSNLFRYEQFLLEWFFEYLGKGSSITNLQIKNELRNVELELKPSMCFEYFQCLVTIAFPLQKYYNKTLKDNSKVWLNVAILFMAFFAVIIGLGGILIAYSMGNILFSMPNYILNEKGSEERDSWLDFKKYLLDFSNIKEKSIEMVKLWNFYITYSIVLDIDSIASKEVQMFFGDDIYNANINYQNSNKQNIIEQKVESYEYNPNIDFKQLMQEREKVIKIVEDDVKSESLKYENI